MAGAWDVVADLLGFGDPRGTDGGSSNWAAWGHAEIRSMLDTSVDSSDISDAASAWRDLGRHAIDVITGLTRDLNETVSGGWRGAAADAAISSLGPVNQWSAGLADTADHTTALMDAAGSSAGQAKATVPPAQSHDWGQSLRSFALSGAAGAVIDAVAQDQAQSEAHAEAVQIMNNVYSAPINDHRIAVPVYPQLVDPTFQPPEQSPSTVPPPDLDHVGGGVPRNGHDTAGGSGPAGGYFPPAQPAAPMPPAAAGLQGVTSAVHAGPADPSGGPVVPTGPRHSVGSQPATGVPIMTSLTGGDDSRRARPLGGVVNGAGAQPGGDRTAGVRASSAGRSGAAAGSAPEFGPRPSGAATPVAESRMGAGLGRGVGGLPAGRAGLGDLLAPIGGGRGNGGEDTEHRRPSYLIELDDVFSDGRKVAPPVIGEAAPERDG